jgi:hypothetical protein
MNSRDDPTQLQWRSLINCIIIGNDEMNCNSFLCNNTNEGQKPYNDFTEKKCT